MSGVNNSAQVGKLALDKLVRLSIRDDATAAFADVVIAINDRASAAKPKKKNFEVAHEIFVARDTFLGCIVKTDELGGLIDKAKEAALKAVSLGETRKVKTCQNV